MTERACKNCAYYSEEPWVATAAHRPITWKLNDCRRNPPLDGAFPATLPDNWCGEFTTMQVYISVNNAVEAMAAATDSTVSEGPPSGGEV